MKFIRPAEILDPHLLGLGIDTFQLESGEERVTLFPIIIGRLSYPYPPNQNPENEERECVFKPGSLNAGQTASGMCSWTSSPSGLFSAVL